jgi:hypothetical protein
MRHEHSFHMRPTAWGQIEKAEEGRFLVLTSGRVRLGTFTSQKAAEQALAAWARTISPRQTTDQRRTTPPPLPRG